MRYIVANNNTCFLALLEMIISDVIGTSLFTQNYLVDFFGMTILEGQTSTHKNINFTNDFRNIGVHVDENKLDSFFVYSGIPLKTLYYPSNQYGDYEVDQKGVFKEKKDYLIYTFSYGSLYHIPEYYSLGHAALLERFDDNNFITIYDPGPKQAGLKTVKKTDLYDAMWDRRGGIYLFHRTDD